MKKLILSSLFVLISIVSFSQGFYNRWVPTSGTDTYTTNITSFTSLSNSVIYVKFTNTNTTAATITINGTLGPAPIRAWDGDSWEVLSGGELDVNTIYKLSYQGSYYELEGIGSGGLESVSVSTSGGTITLDFHSGDNDDAVEKMFIGSATFSSSKAVDFSNSSGKLVFNFHFEITNVAGTITCASCIMSDEDDKWDSGTDTWTPTQTGKYEMGGTWDGSAWKTKIMGPFN